MQIGFHGRIAAPFSGAANVEVSMNGLAVSGLRALLASQYNVDAILHRSVRAAVNDEIVPEDYVIRPGDTVEFMSPVSGG
ncbi:putative molybdopterin converting factor [Hyphomonas neptunium ATCC 15444]|jgi:molybdopterin synthase sulfur carrier subunit|uniref:Putative molybdopterin converting factor n=2 Tax=Hyphomonas TaxID=85 RepID=Q0C1Y4_HYPNA|nr:MULTISPECIES: MoaD/ThiS family protein [Hyphomonas]ABI78692.1 putative molybdopterin converting factor [Hyphomonas neptunium ATCC 15444]KCZ93026.1 putative molybdopterin converting factor [Hyphomonas hirschiana VP5]